MREISEEFKKKIEQKIEELEAKTCVEVVPVFVAKSASYRLWKFFFSVLTYAVVSTTLFVTHPEMDPRELVGFSLAISLLFLLILFNVPLLLRLALPRSVLLHEVEEEAHRQFLLQEVFATRLRSGVLILISDFEQAVYVLADRGLLAKVPASEWGRLGSLCAQDFSKRLPGESFLKALDEVADLLKGDFPPDAAQKNELSNTLRVER